MFDREEFQKGIQEQLNNHSIDLIKGYAKRGLHYNDKTAKAIEEHLDKCEICKKVYNDEKVRLELTSQNVFYKGSANPNFVEFTKYKRQLIMRKMKWGK